MTSPAQLNYLKAMGIPVWVSRDLVVEREKLSDQLSHQLKNKPSNASADNLRDGGSIPQSATSESVSAAIPATANNDSTISKNSALGILNSLDESFSNQSEHSAKHANVKSRLGESSVENTPDVPTSGNHNPNQNTALNNTSTNNTSTNNSSPNNISTNNTSIEQALAESVEKTSIENNLTEDPISDVSNKNRLFETDHHTAYACGSEDADWMVIGHSPEPFNGLGDEPYAAESGVLLSNMLRAVGVKKPRSDAYLINVMDMSQLSVQDTDVKNQLKEKLLNTITKVKPKVILLVGQNAAQNLLNLNDPLIIMRSKVYTISDLQIPCIVTYYPSYLLQKTSDKRKAWDDLKLAMKQLD